MTNNTNPLITCPSCGSTIKLTETLAAPLLQAERGKLREEHQSRVEALRERERVLCKQQEQIEDTRLALEQEISQRVDAERELIRREERKRASEGVAADLEVAQMALAEKDKRLKATQEAELSLRRQRAALEDEKREFNLKLARALDAERDQIREQTRKEDEEATRLRLREKEETISRMRQQIDELRRRSEQGSQELQGKVQERDLEATLRDSFPLDQIEPVSIGRRGADVLHRVIGGDGHVCGTILWESKRTRNFSHGWLPKLRDDQREERADLAVLMTEVLPKGLESFGEVDGVWVTSRTCAMPLATALRRVLIESATTRKAFEGQTGKMELLYSYLTGPHFRQRIEAIIDPLVTMQIELDGEKRAMLRLWAKRAKQIERLLVGSTGLHGDLQGIAGTSLCSIEKLELPGLANEAETSEDRENGSQNAA